MSNTASKEPVSAYRRLVISLVAGVMAGVVVGWLGEAKIIPLAIWDTVAIIYTAWMWKTIWPLSPAKTRALANQEDPGRALSDIVLTLASIASLAAVGLLIIQGSSSSGAGKSLLSCLGVVSVILSWVVIHTLYTLKYADNYYSSREPGVDFNQSGDPAYSDFAYLAFTLGMTFQVSDTDIKSSAIRKAALHHAQISYLFGTVIVATTINLVVGLSSG